MCAPRSDRLPNNDPRRGKLIRVGKNRSRNTLNVRVLPASTLTGGNQLCITRPGTMSWTSRPSFVGKPTKSAIGDEPSDTDGCRVSA